MVLNPEVLNPKQIVAGGYDEIWSRYEEWGQGDEARMRWLGRAMESVGQRRSVLDLGCGTGSKATGVLATEFASVTGVDISPRSLKVAR
jgi:ubiquinone/menaquinone biosynthesis C-methylase UbiE